MKLKMLVSCCLMVCVPISAWSQSLVLSEEHAMKVKVAVQKRGTGEHALVKITMRDKTVVKGYINQIGPESFQVTDNKTGKVSSIAYQDVEKVRKPGLSAGPKIAIVAGVGLIVVGVVLASIVASNEGH